MLNQAGIARVKVHPVLQTSLAPPWVTCACGASAQLHSLMHPQLCPTCRARGGDLASLTADRDFEEIQSFIFRYGCTPVECSPACDM